MGLAAGEEDQCVPFGRHQVVRESQAAIDRARLTNAEFAAGEAARLVVQIVDEGDLAGSVRPSIDVAEEVIAVVAGGGLDLDAAERKRVEGKLAECVGQLLLEAVDEGGLVDAERIEDSRAADGVVDGMGRALCHGGGAKARFLAEYEFQQRPALVTEEVRDGD